MHCPSCGQQQISSETKYCSRCGLPLSLVAEVVSNGGYLPQLAQLNKEKKPFFSRRNGLGFSLIWFLFFLLIMAPFWGIVGVDELAGVSAIIGIFGGLILMVISLIFLPKAPPQYYVGAGQPPGLDRFVPPQQHPQTALPPQQSVPAAAYGSPRPGNWRDTNELQPTSVTESTTRLLTKEDSER